MSADPFPDVPASMKAADRWLVWRLEPDPKNPEKPRKAPKQSRRPQWGAKSTDPRHWSSYPAALRSLRADPTLSGLGFALGDEWAGVDLDHCRDVTTGAIETWAQSVIADLASYTEVSPSGTGVHIVVRGTKPEGACRCGAVEMYDRGRYFTVTGRHVASSPLEVAQRTSEFAVVHARLLRASRPMPPVCQSAGPHQRLTVNSDDAALLTQARQARNGSKFVALFDRGDMSGYGDDHSAADLALCNLLLYWTGGDVSRADALFRNSALMREKWDERRGEQTYGQRTLTAAVESYRGSGGAASPRLRGSLGARKYLEARREFDRALQSAG